MNKNDWLKIIWKWKFKIKDSITWKERVIEQFNLIPAVWKEAFAAQMAWDNTANIWDNLYIAVWDDATAPASWDVALWNETARKAAWSTSFSAWTASIAVFFAAWEATWTHREFWLFWDWNTTIASWTVDTWILFSHVWVNVSVSAVETITITFSISFT